MNIILSLVIIFLFFSCAFDKIVQPTKEKYDLTEYLHKLDSTGQDIQNDTLLFKVGYQNIYYGKNERGNALIEYALSKRDTITNGDYHSWSVQNTKNGNYAIAIDKLEKMMEVNPQDGADYYGWVLLYYYRDYKKALKVLEQYDSYTPNFADAPMGEDIHYLKGLCQMKLLHYQKAIDEFNTYINNQITTVGEDYVDVYTFVEKGRCLTQLGKFEEAISSYKKAISYYDNCSEAYYFMGITQLEQNKKDSACINFNIALNLINQGYKSSDNYIEFFHEIYPRQIEKSIKDCN